MTAEQIALDVYRRLDYADSPPPSVKARIEGFINTQYVRLLSTDRMRQLRETTARLVSIPGQAVYALPVPCARVQRVTDLTNRFELTCKHLEWYREWNPGALTTGTPMTWIPSGFAAAARPVYDGVKTLSASGGLTDIEFRVRVLRHGGATAESAPFHLHSTTPQLRVTVPLPFDPGNRDILDVLAFTGDEPVDDMDFLPTLWGLSDGSPLAQIARGETWSRYYTIALDPTPTASLTYSIDFEQEATKVGGLDEPRLLPPEFHDLLALLARVDEYEFKSDDRWPAAKAQAVQRVMELRQYVDNHDVYRFRAVPEWRWGRSRCGPLMGGIPVPGTPPVEPPVEPLPEDTYMQLVFDGIGLDNTLAGTHIALNWIPLSVPVKIVSVSALITQLLADSPAQFNVKHTDSDTFVFGSADTASWPTFAAVTQVRTLPPDDLDVVYPANTSFQLHVNMPAGSSTDLKQIIVSINAQPQ